MKMSHAPKGLALEEVDIGPNPMLIYSELSPIIVNEAYSQLTPLLHRIAAISLYLRYIIESIISKVRIPRLIHINLLNLLWLVLQSTTVETSWLRSQQIGEESFIPVNNDISRTKQMHE